MIWFDTSVWQTLVKWWPEILQGIIIGVFAGLITSSVIGIIQWFRFRHTRTKQMKHISSLIQMHSKLVIKVFDVVQTTNPNIDSKRYRRMLFDSFINLLQSAIVNRTGNMRIDDIIELEQALHFTTCTLPVDYRSTNVDDYKNIFHSLENIKWVRKHKIIKK